MGHLEYRSQYPEHDFEVDSLVSHRHENRQADRIPTQYTHYNRPWQDKASVPSRHSRTKEHVAASSSFVRVKAEGSQRARGPTAQAFGNRWSGARYGVCV